MTAMSNQKIVQEIERRRLDSPEALNELQRQIIDSHDAQRQEVVICYGTGCMANGSSKVNEALKAALEESQIDAKVLPYFKTTGCQGFCSRGPLVVIRPQGIFYQRVKPKDAQDIVEKTLKEGKVVEHLLYKDPGSGESILTEQEIPFYKLQ